MRRTLAVLALALCGSSLSVASVGAAGSPTHQKVTSWNQHDTAVYVVSTLNLLHTHSGQAVSGWLSNKLDVSHYDVYSDASISGLYFIQLRRDDGSLAGAFAYQMGWAKPRLVSLAVSRTVAKRATDRIAQAYKSDPKQLIGSFTSTLPM